MKKTSLLHVIGGIGASALVAMSGAQASADECGSFTMAEMNWASAELMANIDKAILEMGYGCSIELVPGATETTGASMLGKAQPDVAPEFWYNSMAEVLDKATEDGKLINAGSSLLDGGVEGYWVPKYLVDQHPELKTIEGVKKNPQLFPHPEKSDVGGMVNCPSGWNCQISTANMFEFFGMADAGFELVDSGSGAGLDGSLAKAYERKEGWIGYYWAPTAILGKYEMVKVDPMTGVNEDEFKNCVTQEGCTVTKGSDYPPARVDTLVTADFAKANPAAVEYFKTRGFTNADMNGMLAWMADNQADGETAALHFLDNYQAIWTTWVSEDVSKKIMSSL